MSPPASPTDARNTPGLPRIDPVQQTVTAELLKMQEREAYLPNSSLVQLAHRLGRPLSDLEAVVSFFPHFRRAPPPRCEIHVCRDLVCHHLGAESLAHELEQHYSSPQAGHPAGSVVVRRVSCLGRCDRAPAALIEFPPQPGETHDTASAELSHEVPLGCHARTAAAGAVRTGSTAADHRLCAASRRPQGL